MKHIGPTEISYMEIEGKKKKIIKNMVSISYFEIEEIKNYLHNTYKELAYQNITPVVVIFPEEVYLLLRSYLAGSNYPFMSVEGWFEAVYKIKTVVYGKHIKGIGMY